MKKYLIIFIILPMFLSGCFLFEPVSNEPVAQECKFYTTESCPTSCVVCPPCPECSSISCQTEEFCADMGIDKSWYEEIKKRISNFDECATAGNAVMESYPRQCRAGDATFVEDIGNELEKTDLIRIDYPRPNQKISSPLNIAGQARGTWFFEGDFPVILKSADNTVLAETYASAQSNWMTEDFVEFRSELIFTKPGTAKGLLILKKDNPSDLPENEDALEIPVFFE